MTILFLKRLNDTFEENAEKLVHRVKAKEKHSITLIGIISLSERIQGGQFFLVPSENIGERSTMYVGL